MSYKDVWWKDDAACLGMDIDLFFPKGGQPKPEVLETCGGCSVKDKCLRDALRHEQPRYRKGIWGGLTASEREAMFKEAG